LLHWFSQPLNICHDVSSGDITVHFMIHQTF
jgi:hypothetical protein